MLVMAHRACRQCTPNGNCAMYNSCFNKSNIKANHKLKSVVKVTYKV